MKKTQTAAQCTCELYGESLDHEELLATAKHLLDLVTDFLTAIYHHQILNRGGQTTPKPSPKRRVNNMKTSLVWKANKRRIISNWKKEFIREMYGFRLSGYASAHDERYMDANRFDVDLPEGTIARYIYSHA